MKFYGFKEFDSFDYFRLLSAQLKNVLHQS